MFACFKWRFIFAVPNKKGRVLLKRCAFINKLKDVVFIANILIFGGYFCFEFLKESLQKRIKKVWKINIATLLLHPAFKIKAVRISLFEKL